MAFNPLKRLEQGNVDFLFEIRFDESFESDLIKRIRASENKHSIIQGFIEQLKDEYPTFCLKVIYDVDEYKEYVFSILEHSNESIFYYFGTTELVNILRKTSWGKSFIFTHLDEILEKDNRFPNYLFEYILNDLKKCKDLIDKLSLYPNLRIRGNFMCYLVEYHYDKINLIYDDLLKYLTSYTHQELEQLTFLPEYMPFDTISKLAIQFLERNDRTNFLKIKEFIFNHYPENDLSFLLMNSKKESLQQEFLNDIDRYFSTSYQCQFRIYEKYDGV